MASNLNLARLPVRISSSGTAEGAAVLKAALQRGARVRHLTLRQEADGGMTDCAVSIITNGTTGTAIASVPDEDIVVAVDPSSVTASATVAFVDTPIEGFAPVKDSIEVRIHGITGSGAWVVVGYLTLEL